VTANATAKPDQLIEAVYRDGVQIHQLGYLVALARERHFGHAATRCHVTQPTLSSGIARLEAELGVTLVHRGRRFEGLTADGERTVAWAERILADVDGLRRDLGTAPDVLRGRLRIGAIPTSLPVLARFTKALREAHPQVDLAITSLTSREIDGRLRGGEIDVGVTYLDNEPLHRVRTASIYHERYVLLSSAHGSRERVSWREAATEPLCLLSPDMQHRRIVDAAFARAGVQPRPMLETNSVTALFAHVHAGLGAAIVADTWPALFGIPEGLAVTRLVEPEVDQRVGLVWVDRDPEPHLITAFVTAATSLGTGR
jgi:DNA-binding transcriptional LysR family regulator